MCMNVRARARAYAYACVHAWVRAGACRCVLCGRACMSVRACVCVHARACMHVCMCACVHVFACMCLPACACVRASVRACKCACVQVCVRACVRASVRACALIRVGPPPAAGADAVIVVAPRALAAPRARPQSVGRMGRPSSASPAADRPVAAVGDRRRHSPTRGESAQRRPARPASAIGLSRTSTFAAGGAVCSRTGTSLTRPSSASPPPSTAAAASHVGAGTGLAAAAFASSGGPAERPRPLSAMSGLSHRMHRSSATSAPRGQVGSPLTHLRRDRAQCRTALILRLPMSRLHRDGGAASAPGSATFSHICTATGRALSTSAPGLGMLLRSPARGPVRTPPGRASVRRRPRPAAAAAAMRRRGGRRRRKRRRSGTWRLRCTCTRPSSGMCRHTPPRPSSLGAPVVLCSTLGAPVP